ncbi:MAG: hypothetical protein M3R65_09500 [Gemmatimonadota bacterium]|nr:hypothetical protein [Gemmatimonadota bacterium]
MYSTCLFCHADLGANEVVEHFPVGRRLAFDEAKGRLWVICRSCERWNLTPLEERWEAIEECERLFRGTKLRMSTDHIGLARVSEGLELVRVGEPQRPEMAAWRYGDQFGRRRRRYYVVAGASAVAVGALVSGSIGLGLFAGGGSTIFNVGFQGLNAIRNRQVVARVPTADGTVDVTRATLPRAKFVTSSDMRWSLSVEYSSRPARGVYRWYEYQPNRFRAQKRTALVGPEHALPALAAMLPTVNGRGGGAKQVQSAVELIAEAGNPNRLLETAASLLLKPGRFAPSDGKISTLPIEARLALEMMTHEDAERRALEGDLSVLEERWKEAEEIAAISDNMFLPTSVTDFITKLQS